MCLLGHAGHDFEAVWGPELVDRGRLRARWGEHPFPYGNGTDCFPPIAYSQLPIANRAYEAQALGHPIFTQADSMEELKQMLRDAVACHFEKDVLLPVCANPGFCNL